MDTLRRNNLHNGQAVLELLQNHSGPAQIISGHLHRAMSALVSGILHQVAPAPCHAVHLDQREDTTNSLVLEPGNITIYNWRGADGGLVSDTLPIGNHPGPWPFYG